MDKVGNLRDSCGTEEKAFTGFQPPSRNPDCLNWAVTCLSGSNCRNASTILHQHSSCVPVDGSHDSAYIFANFTSFSLSCFLSGCYSYLHVTLLRAWPEGMEKQKARSSHSGCLEGQGSCQSAVYKVKYKWHMFAFTHDHCVWQDNLYPCVQSLQSFWNDFSLSAWI